MVRHSGYSRVTIGALGILATALAVFVVVQFLYARSHPRPLPVTPEAELGQQLAALHHALEDYAAAQSGQYPQEIGAVLNDDRYFTLPPENPYHGDPLRVIAAGDEPLPGSFSYIPHIEETPAGLRVTEYILVGYGDRPAATAPALPAYANLDNSFARYIVVSYQSSTKGE